MLQTIEKAYDGIDINIVTFRRPTHVYHSDSSPYGLGGYSNEGYAWRFKLPNELLFRASNNFLEFLASIITPWVDLIAKRLKAGDCALSMTDSTTSAGWMRKSNFKESTDNKANNVEGKARSSNQSDSQVTPSSTSSTEANATTSCAALPWLCVKGDFQDHLMSDWLKAQSTVPSRMFARPSGRIADPTLPKTTTYSLASFYKDYIDHSRMKTPKKSNKKQSRPVSSQN
jgi:hypothetical protein